MLTPEKIEEIEASLTSEKRERIKAFNEKCREKRLANSRDKRTIHESVVIFYKGQLVSLPKNIWMNEL